jgi:hypothetical protein
MSSNKLQLKQSKTLVGSRQNTKKSMTFAQKESGSEAVSVANFGEEHESENEQHVSLFELPIP